MPAIDRREQIARRRLMTRRHEMTLGEQRARARRVAAAVSGDQDAAEARMERQTLKLAAEWCQRAGFRPLAAFVALAALVAFYAFAAFAAFDAFCAFDSAAFDCAAFSCATLDGAEAMQQRPRGIDRGARRGVR